MRKAHCKLVKAAYFRQLDVQLVKAVCFRQLHVQLPMSGDHYGAGGNRDRRAGKGDYKTQVASAHQSHS